jgi:hypothetical protein
MDAGVVVMQRHRDVEEGQQRQALPAIKNRTSTVIGYRT